MRKINTLIMLLSIIGLATMGLPLAAPDTDDNDSHEEHGVAETHVGHDSSVVDLTQQSLNAANIKIETLKMQNLSEEISAPGEVVVNAYRSTIITPRINAQVVKRHKTLGDSVSKNQPLVTLTSVEMAQAQGDLLVAAREWQRVKKLGKKVVSEQRFINSRVAYQQAYAKVMAYGMKKSQIKTLLNKNDAVLMSGVFDLFSQQDGTIVSDDFVIGEIVAPGHIMFEITDETQLWIEARLPPQNTKRISLGASAKVKVGNNWVSGHVAQIYHKLDEKTRTFPIRIAVSNKGDQLHPGLFVETRIHTNNQQSVLVLPQEAVLLSSDGDWIVFVEIEPGQFQPTEVDLVKTVEDQVVVEGIDAGKRVVVKGAFFLQSEIAKSGFDVHQH